MLEEFILQKNYTIGSSEHLNLILQQLILKKIYEKELISFNIYEKTKRNIDNEIYPIISNLNKLIKTTNKSNTEL